MTDRPGHFKPLWLLAALVLGIGVLVAASPASFGLKKSFLIREIVPVEGYLYKGGIPPFFAKEARRSISSLEDKNCVLENGVPLRIRRASPPSIAAGGRGQYFFDRKKGEMYFSSSDATDPLTNGRRYEVVTSAFHLPDWALLLLIAAVIYCTHRSCFFSEENPLTPRLYSEWDRYAAGFSLGGLLALTAWMILQPFAVSESFFTSLWLPVLWALVSGVLVSSKGLCRCIIGFASLLLPLAAAYIHYQVGLASHDSFLLGGFIPRSDAHVHFLQAAEMARDGITTQGFNGRFLFPAYFSSLLWLTGLRMDIAHLMVGLIFVISLFFSMRSVSRWTGPLGSALLALIIWIYFRDRCAWLVMTEPLGVTFGLLALPLLLGMVQRRSLTMLLAALLLLSIGFSARPGALFVLPMVVLYAGWWGWRSLSFESWRPLVRIVACMALAGTVMLLGLGSNNLLQSAVFHKKVIPFGNFAYTLNGLLNGSGWSESYFRLHGNVPEVMKENMGILKAHPQKLLQGIGRAYSHAWKGKFLFEFCSERRIGTLLWLLVFFGLASVWIDSRFRDQAVWISLCLVGILLSIPFAPPWDAGERPYAVTMPLQVFMATLGIRSFFRFCLGRGPILRGVSLMPDSSSSFVPPVVMAFIVISLSVFLPIAHAHGIGYLFPPPWDGKSAPIFIPGSSVRLEGPVLERFRSGMQTLSALHPEEAKSFFLIRSGATLSINWNDLENYALLPGAGDCQNVEGLYLDKRMLRR
jgi:hypothetical protein